MQITVSGATGGIGRHVVDQALADGHDVVAYVRTPDKLGRYTPRLRVVVGELSDPAAIQQAVQGSRAVISALGPSLKRGATGTPVARASIAARPLASETTGRMTARAPATSPAASAGESFGA